MKQLGDTVWEVQSDSTDKTYMVNLSSAEGWPTCTCTAFAMNRNRAVGKGLTPKNCKHITSVIAMGGSLTLSEIKSQANKEKADTAKAALRDMLADLEDKPKAPVAAEAVLSGTSSLTGNLTVVNDVAPVLADVPNPGTPVSETIVAEPEPVVPATHQPSEPTIVSDEMVSVYLSDLQVVLDAVEPIFKSGGVIGQTVSTFPIEALDRLRGRTLPATPVTVTADAHTCPRCGGKIPNDETPGAYPGALSRTDNITEVCSQCGTDEAMQQFLDDNLTPQGDWPLVRKYDFPNAKVK